MFENTNEILVLCTQKNAYSIYKLKLDAQSKQKYVSLFSEGADKLLLDEENDERTFVRFSSNDKLSEDEVFTIPTFDLLPCIKEALDNPDTIEPYIPQNTQGDAPNGHKIKAILIGTKEDDGTYIVAGQKFSKAQILLRKSFNLFLDGDTFKEPRPSFSIAASEDVDCLFTGNQLIFLNYTSANKVFDLSEYYREATEEEIQAFKSNEMFTVANDNVFMKNVKGITIRKKIARILDMKTLEICPIAELQEKSTVVGVQLQIENDKIVLPEKKAELKSLLAFLSEEMYKGLITNTTYFTNSSRAIESAEN